MPLDQEQFKFPDEKAGEKKQDEIQFEIEGEGEPFIVCVFVPRHIFQNTK